VLPQLHALAQTASPAKNAQRLLAVMALSATVECWMVLLQVLVDPVCAQASTRALGAIRARWSALDWALLIQFLMATAQFAAAARDLKAPIASADIQILPSVSNWTSLHMPILCFCWKLRAIMNSALLETFFWET